MRPFNSSFYLIFYEQTSTGLKTLEFQVDKPYQPLAQYEFLLGDQVILAPMVSDGDSMGTLMTC